MISKKQENLIIKKHIAGEWNSKIAKEMGVSVNTVARAITRYEEKNQINPEPVYTNAPEQIKEESKMEITKLELPEKKHEILKAEIDAKFADVEVRIKKMKEELLNLFENQKGIVEYLKSP